MGGNKAKGKKKKHRRGRTKDENKEPQPVLQIPIAAYSREIECICFPAKTKRGKKMLVDSQGYQYTQKIDKRRAHINWRCSVRNKTITCKASVMERNGRYYRGGQDHICDFYSIIGNYFNYPQQPPALERKKDVEYKEPEIQNEDLEDVETEEQFADIENIETEEEYEDLDDTETEIKYILLPGQSRRGRELLIDSEGHQYTQKVDRRRTNISWRCSVRNSTISCKASVIERNGEYIRGIRDHICIPKLDVKKLTKSIGGDQFQTKKKEKYSVDQILEKAEECMDTFDFEMAQKYCQRAIEIEPDNVKVLEMTGNLLVEVGDVEGAKKCFGRAVTVCPDTGFSKYMYLGQVFEGQQAIDCFCKGIDIILTERSAEQMDGACAMTSDGGATDNDIASAYCSIAEIYLTDSCFEIKAETQCYENLQLALHYNPNSAEAYQLLASYFLSTESTQQAKEMINKSVSLWLPKLKEVESSQPVDSEFDPVETCPLSYLSRVGAVKILIEVEQFDVAEEILQMLLEEDDEVVQVWYLLGWLHFLQDTEENKSYARHFLHKAKKLNLNVEGSDLSIGQHIDELLQKLGPGDGEDSDDWLKKKIWESVENEDDNDDESSDEEEDMEH